MTAKQYLSQAYYIDRQIRLDEEKIKAMESSLYGAGISYESDGSQKSHGDNSIEKAYCKVIDYKEKIKAEISELIDIRLEIENAIQSVSDSVQREILTRRYLLHQEWESRFDERTGDYIKGIAEEMNYSPRWIYNQHGKALKKLKFDKECS